jgi:succinate-semialdehyde dehydrogenase/glutarate-semialdehyde dehydrogenase
VQIGPLINQEGVDKVAGLIEDAVSKGAKVLAGGGAARGLFFEPTVLGEVVPPMDVLQIEAFGPLAPLTRFDTEAQAIAMANDTNYGLAAYMFTRDVGRTFRVAEALEYGIVSVNEGLPSVAVAPFGGVKESGLGREGGRQGLEEYLETKYICLGVA